MKQLNSLEIEPYIPLDARQHQSFSLKVTMPTSAIDYGVFLREIMDSSVDLQATLASQTQVERQISWGLSWGVEHHVEGTLLFHWGDNPGYKCFVTVDPIRRRAMAIFTNGDRGREVFRPGFRQWFGRDLSSLQWLDKLYR